MTSPREANGLQPLGSPIQRFIAAAKKRRAEGGGDAPRTLQDAQQGTLLPSPANYPTPTSAPANNESCQTCDGTGWVAGEEREVAEGILVATPAVCPECRKPARPAPTLESWTIPAEYSARAKAEMTAALEMARTVAETGGPQWVVLMGPNGAGKTHLALAILAERQRRGETGAMWRAEELMDWLRETQRPDAPVSLGARLAYLRDIKWLVIDEIGKERPTEWAGEQMERLINTRYADKSGLVLTTNDDPWGKDSPFSLAVRSRLSDRSLCAVVTMTGVPDYRRRKTR